MADAVLAECSVSLLSVSEIAAELDWYTPLLIHAVDSYSFLMS